MNPWSSRTRSGARGFAPPIFEMFTGEEHFAFHGSVIEPVSKKVDNN